MGEQSNIELLKTLTEKLNRKDRDLFESEKMFRGFFENSSAGMCIADVNTGMFLEVNPALCDWLGYTQEELLSRPVTYFVAPKDKTGTSKVIARLQNGPDKIISGFVNEYLHKDGSSVWLKWNASVPDEYGINYSVCANITMELRQSAKIARQDKIYRDLTESSAEVVCLHDLEGKYIYLSPSMEEIFGYDRESLIGLSAYDFTHPEDSKRILEESHKPLLKEGSNQLIRFRFKHAQGHYVWVESSSQPVIENGEIVEIRTNTRVITDTIEAEKKAAINQEIYETILQDTRELIKVYEINDDGFPNLIYVSPSCIYYTGYEPEEHIKHGTSDLIHPDDMEEAMKHMIGIIETKERIVIRYRGKHKDKGYRMAESTLSPIITKNGTVSHIVLSSRLVNDYNNDK